MKRVRTPVVAVDPVVRTLWERRPAGKDEQDGWRQVGKTGKSYAGVVKKHEKQLPNKPEGLHASHWQGTVVDLAEFTSRLSTTGAGDHITAGVAAEKPPELGGLLVPDGISATSIALPTMKTSHPTQVLSAPMAGTESGDAAMGNSGFPSGVEADCSFVSGLCC